MTCSREIVKVGEVGLSGRAGNKRGQLKGKRTDVEQLSFQEAPSLLADENSLFGEELGWLGRMWLGAKS